MPRLLIVHHTPSPVMHTLLEQVRSGAETPEIEGVEVVSRPALSTTAHDVLEADGYLLGTPANLGYMSGGLKHFFDTVFYLCLDATVGHPFGLYVHGNNDVDGAVASVEKVTTGLRWKAVQPPLKIIGSPTKADLDAAWNLGATVAANLLL
jgi:multimeric flavodoxin WrbA